MDERRWKRRRSSKAYDEPTTAATYTTYLGEDIQPKRLPSNEKPGPPCHAAREEQQRSLEQCDLALRQRDEEDERDDLCAHVSECCYSPECELACVRARLCERA